MIYNSSIRASSSNSDLDLYEIRTVIMLQWSTQWRSWLRHCATSRKVAARFLRGSLVFFIDIILSAAQWPWGLLSLYRNESHVSLSRGKSGRCVGLTTFPPSCADFLEIPQPRGDLRACTGIIFFKVSLLNVKW